MARARMAASPFVVMPPSPLPHDLDDPLDLRAQQRHVLANRGPQDLRLDLPVAMREDVAEAGDPAPLYLGETQPDLRRQLLLRLSEDEELSFYGSDGLRIGRKRCRIHSRRELLD